jgi:integrase
MQDGRLAIQTPSSDSTSDLSRRYRILPCAIQPCRRSRATRAQQLYEARTPRSRTPQSAELVALEWDQIDLTRKTIRLWRVKGGDPSTHYLANSELRALRRLQRENPSGPHVFVSERGGPVTTGWFRKMTARLGVKADMPFPIHPHQLRHSCGYKFANEGKDTRSLQAYLGHRSINSTVRYTMMSPTRFKGWEKE